MVHAPVARPFLRTTTFPQPCSYKSEMYSVDNRGSFSYLTSGSYPTRGLVGPPGQTKYLILQGADDQIAPPENGVLLQQELGGRATLVNVPGAGHLLPLEKTQTTASHMISFIRQLDDKP
jgi:pimeloyl-ACP methyl ester carboxylesterase